MYKEVQNRKKGYLLSPTDDPFLLRSVLHSQLAVAKFQTPESTKTQIEKRIAWEPLVDIFGTEKALATVVDVVRKICGNVEVFNLSDRYLKG